MNRLQQEPRMIVADTHMAFRVLSKDDRKAGYEGFE